MCMERGEGGGLPPLPMPVGIDQVLGAIDAIGAIGAIGATAIAVVEPLPIGVTKAPPRE